MDSGPVVLIIENSSELRHELRNVMTDILRLEVAEAGDLRAAVELFAGGLRPDLALVDFDGVAGGEVAAWLQRTHVVCRSSLCPVRTAVTTRNIRVATMYYRSPSYWKSW